MVGRRINGDAIVYIIVKDGKPRGTTRSSTDRLLRDQWGTSSFKKEGDADKCAFLERKLKKAYGMDSSRVISGRINEIK